MFGEGMPDPEEPADDGARRGAQKGSWVYEPEPEELLPMLFEEYVDLSVYRALLESAASEHGARMTAMRNAAENAQDMIGEPDAGDEPGPPGGDHSGNLGSRRRSGSARLSTVG